MVHDLRLALRRLAHQRAFALIAILTLAVGIGANTAIFSLVDNVLLRPLPYTQPQQLVALDVSVVHFVSPYPYFPINIRTYHQWRLHSKLLSNLAILQPDSWVLTTSGARPREVYGADVSHTIFPTLGVTPLLGRDFSPGDDRPGKNHEILISDAFWRSEFHADPSIVGRTVDLDGAPNVIIGVMPASLDFPHGTELGPFGTGADHPMQIFRPAALNFVNTPVVGNFNMSGIGRKKPGVTDAQLGAELNVIEANFLAANHAPAHVQLRVVVTPLRDMIVGNHGLGLWMLLAAVGVILLIVCLNLANLLLVRVNGRGHELAIRVALGAGRGRLVKETVTEGIVLAAAGGVLGIVAAWAALRALVHAAPSGIPRLGEVGLNPMVLVFGIVLALVCGVAFSLWPALRSAKADPQSALRAGGRSASDSVRGMRTRSWLVGAQTGLAALLLIVAGLLIASYMDLLGLNMGFQQQHVIEAGINWPGSRPQRAAFYHSVLDQVSALPGVQTAGLIDTLPTQGTNENDLLSYVHDQRPFVNRPLADWASISPGYFAAMGIPLLRGRALNDQDLASTLAETPAQSLSAPIPALISASTAAHLWPGKNPIGQEFTKSDPQPLFIIVGVVADVPAELGKTPPLQVYAPYTWQIPGEVNIVLRTNTPLAAIAPRIRSLVWSTQPAAAVTEVETMADVVSSSVAARHFQMLLVMAFALCALFLAALGIYGVIAYSIERRTGEIGIRMTMGARAGDLVAMVLRQGLTPVVAGIIAGVIAAVLLGHVLASLLFSVHVGDPTVMLAVAALLLAAGALACAWPARRATRINPVNVLRD